MTLDEHRKEYERIIDENTTELMTALESRKKDSEMQKLLIRVQLSKVARELNDNDKKFLNQSN